MSNCVYCGSRDILVIEKDREMEYREKLVKLRVEVFECLTCNKKFQNIEQKAKEIQEIKRVRKEMDLEECVK